LLKPWQKFESQVTTAKWQAYLILYGSVFFSVGLFFVIQLKTQTVSHQRFSDFYNPSNFKIGLEVPKASRKLQKKLIRRRGRGVTVKRSAFFFVGS